MKLEIIKETFIEAVNIIERVTSKHVTLPVLSCILINAEKDGSIFLRATNLDVGVEYKFFSKVIEPGIIAVPGVILKSFISSSRLSKSINIETSDTILKISSGGSKASIKLFSHEDFPTLPEVLNAKETTFLAKELVSGVRSVVYSASISTIKPELSSVYIFEEGGDLVFVATDSFRLAEKRVKLKKPKNIDPVLIPFKNAIEILKIFENETGEINVSSSKNLIKFKTDNITVSSRVIEGNFPDYKQIIPKDFVTTAFILKKDFSQAIKSTGVFSDTFNQVVLSFSSQNKTVSFSSKNNDTGEGVEEIKGEIKGEDITITFNQKYLADCVQSIEGENLMIKVSGASKPLIISDANHESFTYLVMPMNR